MNEDACDCSAHRINMASLLFVSGYCPLRSHYTSWPTSKLHIAYYSNNVTDGNSVNAHYVPFRVWGPWWWWWWWWWWWLCLCLSVI